MNKTDVIKTLNLINNEQFCWHTFHRAKYRFDKCKSDLNKFYSEETIEKLNSAMVDSSPDNPDSSTKRDFDTLRVANIIKEMIKEIA